MYVGKNRGFTLVELIVVLGILVVLGVMLVLTIQDRAMKSPQVVNSCKIVGMAICERLPTTSGD